MHVINSLMAQVRYIFVNMKHQDQFPLKMHYRFCRRFHQYSTLTNTPHCYFSDLSYSTYKQYSSYYTNINYLSVAGYSAPMKDLNTNFYSRLINTYGYNLEKVSGEWRMESVDSINGNTGIVHILYISRYLVSLTTHTHTTQKGELCITDWRSMFFPSLIKLQIFRYKVIHRLISYRVACIYM